MADSSGVPDSPSFCMSEAEAHAVYSALYSAKFDSELPVVGPDVGILSPRTAAVQRRLLQSLAPGRRLEMTAESLEAATVVRIIASKKGDWWVQTTQESRHAVIRDAASPFSVSDQVVMDVEARIYAARDAGWWET